MTWMIKYAPTTVGDCVCRRQAHEVLDFFRQNPYGTLFLIGPHGCGKTTVARLTLQELGYTVRFYDSVSAKNDKLRQELLNLNHNNVLHRLTSTPQEARKKVAIVVDNFDSIALSSEKSVIDDLVHYNLKASMIPMIIIVSQASKKLLEDYSKANKGALIVAVEFPPPDHDTMLRLAKRVGVAEGLEFQNDAVLSEIIEHSQRDLRCMLTTIQDLALCFSGAVITEEVFQGYVSGISERKSRNLGLFEAYREMFACRGNVGRLTSVYNTDKVLLPLTLHENYYREVLPRRQQAAQKLLTICRVSERISKGDLVETDIYSDQSWQLQDMHCFVSCVQPIHLIGSTKNSVEGKPLSFSSELNKTSLKNINRKNFNNAHGLRPSLDEVEDVLELSRIMGDLILDDQSEKVRSLLGQLQCSDVTRLAETIIKIDKCNPNISTISFKWKKQFAGATKNSSL